MYSKTKKQLHKMHEINRPFNSDEIEKLNKLSFSSNADIRKDVAVLLADEYTSESEKTLYRLSFDRIEMVRLEAIDSLCIGRMMMSLQRLQILCSDADPIIRQFAFQSHYEVFLNIFGTSSENKEKYLEWLKPYMDKESSERVRMVLYKIMYLCGEYNVGSTILDLLVDAIKTNRHDIITPGLYAISEMMEYKLDKNMIKKLNMEKKYLNEEQIQIIEEMEMTQ